MKIFTNIHREYLGGMSTTNNALLCYLADRKQEIIGLEYDTVRCMKGPYVLEGINHNFFKHYILNIFDLPFGRIIRSAKNLEGIKKYFRPAIESIKELLEAVRPDIALINGTSYYPWLLAAAARESRIPIVLRYHGIYTLEWKYAYGKGDERILSIERSVNEAASAHIFPSSLCRDIVEKEVVIGKLSASFVIPNPVRLESVKLRRLAKKKIAMVSRWLKIKNIKAFFELHKRLNEQNWKHIATFVSEKTDASSVPESIKQLPPMPYGELCDFYRSQGLIIASSHFETFGNVPMEALCAGTPVLVSDKMGCAEILNAAGLHDMVIDFSDMDMAAERAKELCGLEIDQAKSDMARDLLDPEKTNKKIFNILKAAAAKDG